MDTGDGRLDGRSLRMLGVDVGALGAAAHRGIDDPDASFPGCRREIPDRLREDRRLDHDDGARAQHGEQPAVAGHHVTHVLVAHDDQADDAAQARQLGDAARGARRSVKPDSDTTIDVVSPSSQELGEWSILNSRRHDSLEREAAAGNAHIRPPSPIQYTDFNRADRR
jgi:hypothetical protein